MSDQQTTIIETERLILRPLTMDDLDDLFALYRDPEVRRYFPDGTQSYEQTKEELEWIIDVYYGKHGFGLWATIHKPSGAFIGRCGLLPWTIDGQDDVEVAYLLGQEYWGQGLATEAARAIVDYAFARLPVTRLICMTDPLNHASQNVARKVGMTLVNDNLVDKYGVSYLFALPRPV
jgi:ribosomal-protein-alanine N-acetyltransferase